jgi:hypothetical protein
MIKAERAMSGTAFVDLLIATPPSGNVLLMSRRGIRIDEVQSEKAAPSSPLCLQSMNDD